MSNTLFQAGLSVELFGLNIEETVHHFNKWDLSPEQMETGEFTATIFTVHTPRVQLHDVLYSHGFLMQGSFPGECVMLGYTVARKQVTYRNRVLYDNELVISTESSEIDYLSNGENRVLTISIEKVLFEKVFFAFFGKPFEAYGDQNRFFIKPQMVPLFRKRMNDWMTLVKSNHTLLLSDTQYTAFEAEMLEEILSLLMIEPSRERKSHMKVKKVRDILHASVDRRFDATTLTQELGIGQRQLQRIFREAYGISPRRYLLNLRLNEVRKELLQADSRMTTISTIALKYHFFDLSHFSKTYKDLFLETPSFTLNRVL